MKSFISFLAVLIFVPSLALAADVCADDAALAKSGWTVHGSKDFKSIEAEVLGLLDHDSEDFVADMSTKFLSQTSGRPVQLDSFDRLSTPHEVMYGDVVVILDLRTGKTSELRWFDGKTKHVAYNPEFQNCAMHTALMAENALF